MLEALKLTLGGYRLQEITIIVLIDYGKKRAKQGAGPATLAIDLSFIGTMLTHAAAVHGIAVSPEEVRLARVALKRLDLVGNASERDRRPTQNELDDLIRYFDEKPRRLIPVGRMIRFAVATAMRQEEICKITWEDVDIRNRMVTVRDQKDPRKKDGNNQRVPMPNLTKYDAWEVLLNSELSRAESAEFFRTIINLLEPRFNVLARNSRSMIYIFMTFDTKGQAGYSKPVSK